MSDGIDPNIIKKTQLVLGKHIKKPPLTEKLLSKPPFRFLHDIIVAVIKNTGFLKGVFTQDELLAENVKERETKLAFLNKLIDAVQITTNTELKARATKIVAGLQVNETNLLLQAVAYGIENKLDTSLYKNELVKSKKNPNKDPKMNKSPKDEKSPKDKKNDGIRSKSKVREISKNKKTNSKHGNEKKEKLSKSDNSSSRLGKRETELKLSDEIKNEIDSPSSVSKTSIDSPIDNKKIKNAHPKTIQLDRNISKELESPGELVLHGEITTKSSESDDRPKTRELENGYLVNIGKEEKEQHEDIYFGTNGEAEEVANVLLIEPDKHTEPLIVRQFSARPKSARPKSGDLKEKYNKSSESEKNVGEQDVNENIVLQIKNVQRPKSSLRPPSVRPSSARPGAPRLKPDSSIPIQEVIPMGKINVIIENFDKDMDDEETVVIHNAPEESLNMLQTMDLNAKNQSHLVEQILNQLGNNEEVDQQIGDVQWDHEISDVKGRDTTSKEMNQLRNLVQSFTKTANPLGKLLNYLHEDIETMHAELEQWIKNKSQLFVEIEKQEKIKLDLDKPLLEKLERLNQDIKKQEQEINNVRSNIIHNDIRIKQLILK